MKDFTLLLKEKLEKLIQSGGSDLHIKAKRAIYIRVQGDIIKLDNEIITPQECIEYSKILLKDKYDEFLEKKEIDTSFALDEKYRFRVNCFFQNDGISIVFRSLRGDIFSIKELGLSHKVNHFTTINRGLVLVTGVTGSGKSTTLSALINEINETQQKHIITIEDPIEFIHKDKKSIINQRAVGEHTQSFSMALRASLREDPDIILVGEMRDLETIEIALQAAQTGHLVFATLHTIDAKETINRIIGVFPSEEQNRIRITLSDVIQGIISQRLVKKIDGTRYAIFEILTRSPRIVSLIRENRDNEIKDALEEGFDIYNTQTFDQGLLEAYFDGIITKEEALKYATNPDEISLKFKGVNSSKKASNSPLEDMSCDIKTKSV